jgi:microcystin-dependent protein
MANFKVSSSIDRKPELSTALPASGKNIVPFPGIVMPYAGIIKVGTSITTSVLLSNTATITTSSEHNLSVGDQVRVDASNNTYDGFYIVTGVTSNTFSYTITNANIGSASTTGFVYIPPTGWLFCSGNVFDSSIYPGLFNAIGSTTLPDMRNRYIVGTGTSGEVRTISGVNTHNHSISLNSNAATGTGSLYSAHTHVVSAPTIGNDDAEYFGAVHGHNANIAISLVQTTDSVSRNTPANQANTVGATHSHTVSSRALTGLYEDYWHFSTHTHTAGSNQNSAAAVLNTAPSTHTHNSSSAGAVNYTTMSSSPAIPNTIYMDWIIKT